ncbi:MAG: STAS domain-containing protein [Bacteroidales bacterium]|nr:STAS domain-containing protein [Bacteroidales bacterium]
MNISIEKNGDAAMTAIIEGRIDTLTAPALQEELTNSWEGVTELVLDFGKVEYISSAGLRVLISAEKQMASAGGRIVLKSVSPVVMEVLEMTGLSNVLHIE